MPRNGSGQYALPSGNPVVSNTIISASGWANPTLSDIASALTDSIAADGQTVPTANLPMGNFRHTQVANAMARTDYASAGQVQDNALKVLTGIAGTGDAITANLIPGIAAYATGAIFEYPITTANTTTTPTLSIDGLPAKTIVFADGGPLTAGALLAGGVAQLYFDGTNFRTLSMNTPSKDLARIGSQGGTMAGPLVINNTLDVSGNVTGNADIKGNSLTALDNITATSASLSGALNAASSTLTGNLNAAGAAISGALSAGSVNTTGAVTFGGQASAPSVVATSGKVYFDAPGTHILQWNGTVMQFSGAGVDLYVENNAVWHSGNFTPANYASAGAQCPYNTGVVEFGYLYTESTAGGASVIGDLAAPYVMTGLRRGADSNGVFLYLRGKTLRNQ